MWTPPDFDKTAKYPVLYLLHGIGGDVVGLVLVALFLWHDLRARRIAATADPPSANW